MNRSLNNGYLQNIASMFVTCRNKSVKFFPMINTTVVQLTNANKDMALGNIKISEDIETTKESVLLLEKDNAQLRLTIQQLNEKQSNIFNDQKSKIMSLIDNQDKLSEQMIADFTATPTNASDFIAAYKTSRYLFHSGSLKLAYLNKS